MSSLNFPRVRLAQSFLRVRIPLHLRATMNYRGKVTREIDKKIPLAQVQEGNYSLDFGTFGKFTASVTLEKNGNTVRALSNQTIGVTADSYNIAPVSATLPVAMFSLNLWGEKSIRKSGPCNRDV